MTREQLVERCRRIRCDIDFWKLAASTPEWHDPATVQPEVLDRHAINRQRALAKLKALSEELGAISRLLSR